MDGVVLSMLLTFPYRHILKGFHIAKWKVWCFLETPRKTEMPSSCLTRTGLRMSGRRGCPYTNMEGQEGVLIRHLGLGALRTEPHHETEHSVNDRHDRCFFYWLVGVYIDSFCTLAWKFSQINRGHTTTICKILIQHLLKVTSLQDSRWLASCKPSNASSGFGLDMVPAAGATLWSENTWLVYFWPIKLHWEDEPGRKSTRIVPSSLYALCA